MAKMTMTPERIQQLRHQTGMSQYDFAKKHDLGLRALQSWEQGKRTPGRYSIAILRRIFSALLAQ